MTYDIRNLQLKEVEIGHGFITLYGAPHQDLLQLGTILYTKLPKALKELNRGSLRHIAGDPKIFHPYGNSIELGRDPYQHFHIMYNLKPTNEDILIVENIIKQLGVNTANIIYTDLEDRVKEGVDTQTTTLLSKRLLTLWLEERTETIDELLQKM